MWEWRVFGPPEVVPIPAAIAGGPRLLDEERQDLYLLLDAALADAGLKVRSVLTGAKCELKRRYTRDPAGLELWEKVFETRLPLAPEWLEQLYRHLGAVGPAKPVASADELAQALQAAGLGKADFALVKKKVTKVALAPAYSIEVAEIELVGGPRLRTVSVEGPTLELCRSQGERAGLWDVSGVPAGAIVAGYPEAISHYLDRGANS